MEVVFIVEHIHPEIDGGRFPIKRTTGERVHVAADIHADGHDALAAYVRRLCTTYYHPAGTCRMGRDENAVTDERLLVHGLDNLRVADASVMPEIVSGNTNAPAMMIGWRGAEFALTAAGAGSVAFA